MVKITKNKETVEGSFVQSDQRGRHTPFNKTSDELLEGVRRHINSFPRVESHYCRKSSTRQFLGADLNIQKMYRLYQEWCEKQNFSSVKIGVYLRIFNSDFNLYFHRPKKDMCRVCEKYNNMNSEERAAFQEHYDRHMQNKEQARMIKEADKQRATEYNSFRSYTFDLQSVLYTPCSQVSSLYYTRKFCTYNLTIYDQATKKGSCYMWSETEGKRGSDEIGTCLKLHLDKLPEEVTHISLFSDCCGGQNRNRYVNLSDFIIRTTSTIHTRQ